MKNRVITRKRGVIPGCIPAARDNHMAVDGLGRPWIEVAKLPSTIDFGLPPFVRRPGNQGSGADVIPIREN